MLRNTLLLIGLAAASLAFAVQPASAQATRTWVSGVGDDVNPCSRTAPCKTFAGAISKTAAGGEISVLDPGGFGAVTITKAITIDGGGGQIASTLVSGTNGIVISAPATATVTLRNLRINGIAGSTTGGLNGVQFLAGGALHIEHCTIFGFTQNAVNINLNSATAVNVFVTDTVISNSVGGLTARNAGAGNLFVSAQRTTFAQNTSFGLRADGSGGAGSLIITASESLMAGNGAGVSAVGGPAATAGIQVTRSTIMTNTTAGLLANGTAGPAFVFSSNNLITGNAVGMSSVAGGNILTYKNNATDGNFTAGAFTGVIAPE